MTILKHVRQYKTELFSFLVTFSKLSPLSEETPSRMVSLQNSPVKMSRATPSTRPQMSDDVFVEEEARWETSFLNQIGLFDLFF